MASVYKPLPLFRLPLTLFIYLQRYYRPQYSAVLYNETSSSFIVYILKFVDYTEHDSSVSYRNSGQSSIPDRLITPPWGLGVYP